MASDPTIRLSDLAPDEAVHFSLGQVEFDLGGSGRKTFQTSDPIVLANAASHPWLVVERAKVEAGSGVYVDNQVKPEDDPLSAQNSVAFDADEIAKVEAAKAESYAPTAIEAGLDQSEVVKTDEVAETVAAANEQPDDDTNDTKDNS